MVILDRCPSACLSAAGLTRREVMENCVDRFTEIMQDGRRHGPESNRTRHLCLGTVTKPLGYLSSGMKVARARVSRPESESAAAAAHRL